MNLKYFCIVLIIAVLFGFGCDKTERSTDSISNFVAEFESDFQRLNTGRDSELLKQTSTGEADSLEYFEGQLERLLTEPELYDNVVAYRKVVTDELIKRKLDLIYYRLLRYKIDNQSDIINLIDSLNLKIDKFTRTSISDMLNSSSTYFLCEFSGKNISNINKKLLWEIGDGLGRLVRLRNLAARQIGYNSYASINELIEYSGVLKSNRMLDQIEEKSDTAFKAVLEMSEDNASDNIETICRLLHQQADLKNEYGYYFSFNKRKRTQILVNTFKTIGFDINKLPIYFIDPESTVISEKAYCFPISYPYDIRIVTNSSGNIESFYSLYYATVYAIYAANMKPGSYLFRYDPTSLRSELILSMFDNLISTEEWRNEHLDLPRDFATRLQQDKYRFKILDTRARLVAARFEKRLYLNDAWQVEEVFAELFERIMHCPLSDTIVWWSLLDTYVNRPFYVQRKLIADVAAAQVWNNLTAGAPVSDSSFVADALGQNCFASGQRYDWYEMLHQITGEEFNADYYLRRTYSTAIIDK